MLSFLEKLLPQILQENGFSPVWDLRCVSYLYLTLKGRLQNSHVYLASDIGCICVSGTCAVVAVAKVGIRDEPEINNNVIS